jgi:hypothetical protein
MGLSFSEKIKIREKLAVSKCANCRHFANFNNWSIDCKGYGLSLSTSGIHENARNFYITVIESKDFVFMDHCDRHDRILAKPKQITRVRTVDGNREHWDRDRFSTRDNTFGDLSFGLFDGM